MRTLASAIGLSILATPLAAQAPAIPIMNAGLSRGFSLASMVGFNNVAAGDGTGFLLSGTAGFRRVAVGAFVSGWSGSALGTETVVARGASVAVKLAGGPLVPVGVTLLTGAGYYSPNAGGLTNWRVPVGLGISWTIPQPVVALKFWVSPRLDYSRIRATRTTTATEFGMSGGVNFGFLNGFGLDLAVDRSFTHGLGAKPASVGLGASYNFR
ncbi:MAG: hypothetical protein EXR94_09190 [Gemmatimonadetes bacterium]|nr:hypothetical protein [Gemmatimonadota bacterium]